MRINVSCFSRVVNEKKGRVKIMRPDGEVIKVTSAVKVKEILADHPDHEMFEANQSSRLNIHGRPLSPTTSLRPGRLYFLIPFPTQSTFSRPQMDTTSVSKKDFVTGDIKSRSISSTNKGSPVRLKIRLSKEEAYSLLSLDGNTVMGDLMAPLFQQAIKKKQENSWDSFNRQWRPSLETVFEELSPRL